jgi:hypothetical protein
VSRQSYKPDGELTHLRSRGQHHHVWRNRAQSGCIRLLVSCSLLSLTSLTQSPVSRITSARAASSGLPPAGGARTLPPPYSSRTVRHAQSAAWDTIDTRCISQTHPVRSLIPPDQPQPIATEDSPPFLPSLPLLSSDNPGLMYFTGLRFTTDQTQTTWPVPEWSGALRRSGYHSF